MRISSSLSLRLGADAVAATTTDDVPTGEAEPILETGSDSPGSVQ